RHTEADAQIGTEAVADVDAVLETPHAPGHRRKQRIERAVLVAIAPRTDKHVEIAEQLSPDADADARIDVVRPQLLRRVLEVAAPAEADSRSARRVAQCGAADQAGKVRQIGPQREQAPEANLRGPGNKCATVEPDANRRPAALTVA